MADCKFPDLHIHQPPDFRMKTLPKIFPIIQQKYTVIVTDGTYTVGEFVRPDDGL